MRELTVALAGNPNVGKSTIFNALTGMRQHTGNWPGKTVEAARGYFHTGGYRVELVDLPGTYALEGLSEDERIAAEYIESGQAHCTVVVCDGAALERNLILAIQILQRTQSVILCVNLMDEASRRGYSVDGQKLSKLLGVPVLLTAAGKKEGIKELKDMIESLEDLRFAPQIWYDPMCQSRQIADECVEKKGEEEPWRLLLDRILVSRRRGIPIMLILLFLVVFLTVWGANYPSMVLQAMFDWGYRLLYRWMSGASWWMRGLLLDGVYTTAARVMAVMLPPMLIFFPLFTFLEDVGYFPRMAFLLDGAMERCGGCGRQALTMCMGLGCNAVGVTGCRIIGSAKERTAAILTNSMIPCNGRFPTLILLAGMILPGAMGCLAVGCFVVFGVLGVMGITGLLNATKLRYEENPFIMELPPLRKPRLGQILVRSLLDRSVYVAGRALAVAAPAGAVIWLLTMSPLLVSFVSWLEPVGAFLGMDGAIILSFLLSVPANELLLPILAMILGKIGGVEDLSQVLSLQSALCMMVFTVFHWPCATTLWTIRKETASFKKTAAAALLPTAVGILLCVIVKLLV